MMLLLPVGTHRDVFFRLNQQQQPQYQKQTIIIIIVIICGSISISVNSFPTAAADRDAI